MHTKQNKEFLKLEIRKKLRRFQNFLILKQDTKKLEKLLAQFLSKYVLALLGKKVNIRYKLTDNSYVSCNDQYKFLDLYVFFTIKDDTTGTVHPTRRGISYKFNETKRLREIIENTDFKLNINALIGYLESDV